MMRTKYKIAIIGLGSIGKRHLSNIDAVLRSRGAGYTVDLIRRRDSAAFDGAPGAAVAAVYTEHEQVPDDYDVIFVTNPTHLHYATIKEFSRKTKHMFIEKPVFSETTVNVSELGLRADGVYYVACPLRYTEVIQYIKNQVDVSKVRSVRAICSSYLPDWRPGTDYRQTYSAHRGEGGGVSTDLIHEWDYITYLFGRPKQVMKYSGKFSDLEIDSDDLAVYIAAYENMTAEVHLDYFGRKPVRGMELFTSEETIAADFIHHEIRFLTENRIIRFREDRNTFHRKELAYFFDVLEGKRRNENDIDAAFATLKLAKEGILQ